MKTKKKILIVENEPPQYRGIKSALEKKLGENCFVYPQVDDNKTENFTNMHYLIKELKAEKESKIKNFERVLNYFKYIDIFIIDVHLITSTDTIGLEFANYILDTKLGYYEIILISDTPIDIDDGILSRVNVSSFKKKRDVTKYAPDLVKTVTQVINKMLKLEN